MEIKINHKGQIFICFIDNEDLFLLKGRKVYIHGITGNKYCAIKYQNQCCQIHRLITNCPKHLKVDHINGDFLDNRKSNLRICTQKNNARNMKKRKNTTSKYKGVCWHKRLNSWCARICVDYKLMWLGQFKNEIDAANAYNEAAIKHFGDFAKLNEL